MSLEEIEVHVLEILEVLKSQTGKVPSSTKGFLTLKHAAEYSDLSVESLRRLCGSGKLTALRPVKGLILIERKELDAYIRSCVRTPRTGRGRHRSK